MTLEYPKIIQEIAQKEIVAMLHVAEHGCKNVCDFEIDCSDLKDYNSFDIRQSSEHEKLFKKLSALN